VTVNEAAVTVPAIDGDVTPVSVLVPAGTSTTVPPPTEAIILPKLMSAVREIEIGATMTAVAVAVAWANTPAEKAIMITEIARILFIVLVFKFVFNYFFLLMCLNYQTENSAIMVAWSVHKISYCKNNI
jgi:hypothetical protein